MRKHNQTVVLEFFELLNKANIEYLLIKNICNELPDNLLINKDIDIMVKSNQKKILHSIIKKQGGIEMIHPYGPWAGYQTLYDANPPIMYILPSKLMIDVTNILCIKCLNMKAWIPLDKAINSSIWNEKDWNYNLKCWQMDEKNYICYLIARSLFDKHEFESNYINEIKLRKYLLDDADVIQKLEKIFFGYTDNLIKLIKNDQYNKVLNSYIKFENY